MPYRDTDPPDDVLGRVQRIADRVERIEKRQDATDQRLEHGAQSFAAQRSKMGWFLAGLIVTILSATLAVGRILQVIDETRSTLDATRGQLERLRDQVDELQIELVRQRGAVERADDRATRVEQKIDQVLEQPRRRPR